MGWNPSAPDTIGLEWHPTIQSVSPLTTATDCVAFVVDSTATETIDEIYVPHTWTGPTAGYGKLIVDVYDLSDTGAGDTPATTRYAPNEDKAISNLYAPAPGSWGSTLTLGNGYTKIDDGASHSDADWLAFPGGSYLRMAFGTAAFTGRPTSVSFDVRVFGYAGQNGKLYVELYNGTTYVQRLGTITPPANGADWPSGFATYRIGPFTTNPLTGLPWTSSDITSFDTGTNLLVQLTGPVSSTAVSWLSMIVESGTDKRVATGSTAVQTSPPSGTQTGLAVTLAANWSKASGTDYLLVARRIDDPAGTAQALIPQPVYLDGDASPHGQGVAYSATIDSSGLLSDIGTADATKVVPFWLARTDNAMSADSNPYRAVVAEGVSTSGNVYQDLVDAAGALAYKRVVAYLAVRPTALPDASISVIVKRTSDNVQMGGSATLAVADLSDASKATLVRTTTIDGVSLSIYRVEVNLSSSATLATATEYYLQWSSSASPTTPWYALYLDGTASHALTGDVTYGGSGVVGWFDNSTNDERITYMQTFGSVPAAPSSITVTKTTTTINGAQLDYAAISWVSAGSLGADFYRWELERSEDGGTTWDQIATISTEATVTFDNYTSIRDVAVKYRVRVVRADLAPSDWTTQSGTITPVSYPGSWALFTTDADPSLTVGYTPDGTLLVPEFLSADEVEFVPLHDEDYQASFAPLEERGVRLAFRLQVHTSSSTPSVGHGVRVYDALRAVARASGSLCLHTADGERFFGTLQVQRGHRDFATGAYYAEVTFTETAGAASAVAL